MHKHKNIRNFCIIAHIDHGKSTLADRLIESTGMLTKREMRDQILDNMDLERERGITIKLQTVQLVYKARDGKEYILNLIDTPGHVDFTYEVSRSLAACEGALLVVDASQGIEAQTLANLYLALENNLEIVPVINKIDLPSAHPDRVKQEIEDILGIDASDAPLISAKEGTNIEEVLEAVVAKIPPPSGYENAPLKALIFDSYYDSYRGAISYVRVFEGAVKPGMDIKMVSTGKTFEVDQVGIFTPAHPVDELKAGSVELCCCQHKKRKGHQSGDTMTDADNPPTSRYPGYKRMNSMVFCGIYPADGSDYEALRSPGKVAATMHPLALRRRPLQPGLWFQMRFPGAFAYGGCSGTTGEGI